VDSKNQSSKSSKKITSMADLLASYETKPKRFSLGEKVEGIVIDKLPSALVLDIGGKSEGMVAEKAYIESKDFIRQLEIGDKVTGRVIVSENPQGYTILSLRDASKDFFWNKLEKLEKEGEEITVLVKGGLGKRGNYQAEGSS
jgi:ribosomal protein S1